MTAMMRVVSTPWVVSMTTLVATSPRFSMVLVVTEVMYPMLLLLK